ncbi:MAG: SDR family NAD(P)-dependent oxidoreductase, partial [Streptosporangiaceae bacterium]
MQGLDGQVAIVTGGAQGIGFGIATVLRAEGANVVVADVDEAAAKAAA